MGSAAKKSGEIYGCACTDKNQSGKLPKLASTWSIFGGPISILHNGPGRTTSHRMSFSSLVIKRDLLERAPLLPVMLALLCAFGLLFAFHHVVTEGKRQAELRHRATAIHAVSVWNCNGVPGIPERDRCLSLLTPSNSTRPGM